MSDGISFSQIEPLSAQKPIPDLLIISGVDVQVQLQYSRSQYRSTQQLLQVVELYQANAPYRHLRPSGRPRSGTAPCMQSAPCTPMHPHAVSHAPYATPCASHAPHSHYYYAMLAALCTALQGPRRACGGGTL